MAKQSETSVELNRFYPPGMGCIPDTPDPRDLTWKSPLVVDFLKSLALPQRKRLPRRIDLQIGEEEGEFFFSGVSDQGNLNCSSACAVLGVIEYFERRIFGRTFEGSELFLYQAGCHLRQNSQLVLMDAGLDIRSCFKILRQLGVPASEYWPLESDRFRREPTPFLYGLAKPLNHLVYFRLDDSNCTGKSTWKRILSFLAAGFPIVFGFSVPGSLTDGPEIPFRPELDRVIGYQAALAIGYELDRFGRGQHGLLFRNSWGRQWGDHGNGWLHVRVVENQIATGFWTAFLKHTKSNGELSRPAG